VDLRSATVEKRYEITVLGVVKARESGITDFSRDPTRCLDALLSSSILFTAVRIQSKMWTFVQ